MTRGLVNRVKVLFLAANPADKVALHLHREIREIEAKIRASEYRDSLELVSRWAVRPDDLLQAILEVKPQIVHLSGHGTRIEGFLLQDQDGLSQPVDKETLVQLFGTLKDDIRAVLLNACSTKPLAEAVVHVIDCAIGMNQPIDDDASIIFAASFYRAIGFGQSVLAAFDLGKLALKLENMPEAKTPELFVREGVDASKMILVTDHDSQRLGEFASVPTHQIGTAQKPVPNFDRGVLVAFLSRLAPPSWATYLASIPGAAAHVSHNLPIPEQVGQLIRWAESPDGPRLERLWLMARTLFPSFR